ncbi:hypothetical protein E1I18_00500 [Mycoplasmopsis mucosicanis]|uniref:Ig protease IdeS domain-containing protein n=1 Tax=Mycoplasmopsis mucosicanis TaxID=458208 RepID=A0A507SS41_9BACT|nr:IdeS/Mac family cysteine endopeptidase [Mycoplasmopsis mucosicanis]TQC54071.1 hypothetical protein E1I18_00500 [Mycoplasmopsis mucosicanis]
MKRKFKFLWSLAPFSITFLSTQCAKSPNSTNDSLDSEINNPNTLPKMPQKPGAGDDNLTIPTPSPQPPKVEDRGLNNQQKTPPISDNTRPPLIQNPEKRNNKTNDDSRKKDDNSQHLEPKQPESSVPKQNPDHSTPSQPKQPDSSVPKQNPDHSEPKQPDSSAPEHKPQDADTQTIPKIKMPEITQEFWDKHPALLSQKTRAKYSVFLGGVKLDPDGFKNVPDEGLKYIKERQENDWWYDTNKDFDIRDNALCAAITATNWLHYWLRQNKKYVDEYLKDSSKGFYTATLKNIVKTLDLRELMKIYEDSQKQVNHKVWKSKFFDFFKERYSGTFVNPNMLIDHYINGYSYNAAKDRFGGENYEYKYKKPEPNKSFFADVFGKHILTRKLDSRYISRKQSFSKALLENLVRNNPLGISHNTLGKTTGHIINVWGADFDENYNVVGLYITNSDDPYNTVDDNGTPKLANVIYYNVWYNQRTGLINVGGKDEENTGANLWDLYSVDLGQEYFEAYFKNHKNTAN